MIANTNDVLATGLPRSGTTLTCHLLNKLPDTIALHEPLDLPTVLRQPDPEAKCDEIQRFFTSTRKALCAGKGAYSRQMDGKIPDNHVPDAPATESGLRKGNAPRGKVTFDKQLTASFLLVVKHPVFFTGMLDTLVTRFCCFAVIRNPLSVLGSWNSVSMPVREGRAPNAERLNPSLKETLDSIEDRIERQIYVLSWFCDMYSRTLPTNRIVRYEDVVSSGGRALQIITPRARELNEPLKSKNKNEVYERINMRELGDKLLKAEGAFWKFYSRESVEELLK